MYNLPNHPQQTYSHLPLSSAIPKPCRPHIAASAANNQNNAIRVRQKVRVSLPRQVLGLCCCSSLHRPTTSSTFAADPDNAIDGTKTQSIFRRRRSFRRAVGSISLSQARRRNRVLQGGGRSTLRRFQGLDGWRREGCARRFGHSWALVVVVSGEQSCLVFGDCLLGGTGELRMRGNKRLSSCDSQLLTAMMARKARKKAATTASTRFRFVFACLRLSSSALVACVGSSRNLSSSSDTGLYVGEALLRRLKMLSRDMLGAGKRRRQGQREGDLLSRSGCTILKIIMSPAEACFSIHQGHGGFKWKPLPSGVPKRIV